MYVAQVEMYYECKKVTSNSNGYDIISSYLNQIYPGLSESLTF
jgi:hypothetical protein